MKTPLVVKVPLDGEEVTARLRPQTSGIYHCEWWHRGQHYNRSTKFSDLTRARTAAGLIVKRAAGERLDPERGSVLLGAAVERYIADRWPNPAPGHRHSAGTRQRLNQFIAAAGASLNLAALTYDQAVAATQKFIAGRRKEVGATSLINDKNALSGFFNWLLRTRDVTSGEQLVTWRFNPAASKELNLEKSNATLKPAIGPEDLTAFLRAAKQRQLYDGKMRRRLIWRSILLCLGAGARPIEAARVKWNDIDLQAGTVVLFSKKRPRKILMSAWLIGRIKKIKRPKKPNAFFVTGDARLTKKMSEAEIIVLNAQNQQRRIRRLRKSNTLSETCTLQALRRTAARKAAPHMTPQQYSEYFGHSLPVAVKHYYGYGLFGAAGAQNVLDFSPEKKDDHTPNHTSANEKTA